MSEKIKLVAKLSEIISKLINRINMVDEKSGGTPLKWNGYAPGNIMTTKVLISKYKELKD